MVDLFTTLVVLLSAAPSQDQASTIEAVPNPSSSAQVVGEETFAADTTSAGFAVDTVEFEAPFAVDTMNLSTVLAESIKHNIDLRSRVVDVKISEAQILASLGAFDLRLTAGTRVMAQENTPRGSTFVFSTGSKQISGYLGVSQRLTTGGNISLRLDLDRMLTDQPLSFFNPAAGSSNLASYEVRPTLTITHPLLKGLGIKVNRAQERQARIARDQAEAATLETAQNLLRDVIRSYWDVLFAKRDLENKRRSRELAQQQLTQTQAQVHAGRLAPIDLKAVEQALAVRDSEVLIAENTLLDRSLTLRTFMGQEFAGRGPLGVIPTTDPTDFNVTPVDVQREIERALTANPQVRRLQLALGSKRIDELVNANQRLAKLDFTGSFTARGRSVDTAPDPQTGTPGETGNWGEAFRNFVNEDIRRNGLLADFTVSGALDLTWDVQNRAALGNHKRVLAEIKQSELNLKKIRQTIATAVVRAANSQRTAGKRIEVTAISVELAEQNLSAEQARFQVGRSTNYDVLQRLDQLSLARADALGAQIDYLKAIVELQALNGEILPAYGMDLPRYVH